MMHDKFTVPMMPLDIQQRLLIERINRLQREGIEPIATRAKLRTVQRKQAREFKLHFNR